MRTTLGAPGVNVNVDDVRGFQNVFVNGVPTTVSGTNTLTVTVGSNAYTLRQGPKTTESGGVTGRFTLVRGIPARACAR